MSVSVWGMTVSIREMTVSIWDIVSLWPALVPRDRGGRRRSGHHGAHLDLPRASLAFLADTHAYVRPCSWLLMCL